MTEWNDMMEVWVGSGKFDAKGREIGYIVGTNSNGIEFAAWVQNGRKDNNGFKEFGAPQRSKLFKDQESSVAWAYRTAKERIANL